ncbi:MAG: putative acetyltransferase, partial [Bryobacterales bacterium]|nr:putative acetyltransferase [Bryobacterales bacterium]
GCARMLLEKLIGLAELRGIETLKLDATAMGEPLYRSLGFVAEQPVERWRGELAGSGHGGVRAVPNDLDLEAFGVDRTAILESIALRGKVTALDAGFAMTRPGRVARYLGPCVARDQKAAEEVIAMALSDGGLWYWDLLPRNAAAVSIAAEHGFAPVRQLTRMWRGKPLRGRDEMVFAIGGFEIG